MDQAEMLTMLSGLYDKLVKDVAAKVVARMAERPVGVDAEMRAVAEAVFDDRIEAALENYDPSDAVDVDGKIELALENYDPGEVVQRCVDNVAFDDLIQEALARVRFEVCAH